MTAEELARLKHDVENLDECNHNYDVELARILKAAPALIARAEWAERAHEFTKYAACSRDRNTPEFLEDLFAQIRKLQAEFKALAAYPEGE